MLIQTPNKENWNELKIHNMDWDFEIDIHRVDRFHNPIWMPYQVISINDKNDNPMCHCIGGNYGNNNFYCYPLFTIEMTANYDEVYTVDLSLKPTLETICQFDGEAPCYSVHYNATNYRKTNEFRNGASCIIFRNGKRFFEVSGRTFEYCSAKTQYILEQLTSHPINFRLRNWKDEMINRKIWWNSEPAIVRSIIESQGCIMIEPDKKYIQAFRPAIWMIPESEPDFEPYEDSIKTDYLSNNIYWHRTDHETDIWLRIKNGNQNKVMSYISNCHKNGQISEEIFHHILKLEFQKL